MSKRNTEEQVIETLQDEGSETTQPVESAPNGETPDPIARELLETKEQLLRIAAEYDNFRKRTAREREALFGSVKADAIALFLPVLDNLERAAAAPTTDQAYAQGVGMISKQFVDILTKAGVDEIEALEKPFDSGLHDAVVHVEQEGAGESEIVEVFQKGYKMGDRVIRHSVVKVAN